jgi:hypothetical protein
VSREAYGPLDRASLFSWMGGRSSRLEPRTARRPEGLRATGAGAGLAPRSRNPRPRRAGAAGSERTPKTRLRVPLRGPAASDSSACGGGLLGVPRRTVARGRRCGGASAGRAPPLVRSPRLRWCGSVWREVRARRRSVSRARAASTFIQVKAPSSVRASHRAAQPLRRAAQGSSASRGAPIRTGARGQLSVPPRRVASVEASSACAPAVGSARAPRPRVTPGGPRICGGADRREAPGRGAVQGSIWRRGIAMLVTYCHEKRCASRGLADVPRGTSGPWGPGRSTWNTPGDPGTEGAVPRGTCQRVEAESGRLD